MRKEILLNHVYLKNRILELGIKQWWLADQVGVDKKTVTRWINGHIRSVQIENAERLASILDCKLSLLELQNSAERLASAEEQKAAARLLIGSSLIEKLGPIGEWNVIEGLLKAAMVPGLPLDVLGQLYSQVAIACWRQSKIDQAEMYNAKAEEIALRCEDHSLLAATLASLANIQSWRGQIGEAIATYHRCLSLSSYIEKKALAGIYSNLGAVLYESGEYKESDDLLKKAIVIFETDGLPINLSIAYCHLAMSALQRGLVDRALRDVLSSVDFAQKDDYRRGLQMGKLLQAEIAALRKSFEQALALTSEAIDGFHKLGIDEGLNYEIAGRVHRLCGESSKAEILIRHGISIAKDFPMELAALHIELAEVLKSENGAWKAEAQSALTIYTKCGAPLKAEQTKSRFAISI